MVLANFKLKRTAVISCGFLATARLFFCSSLTGQFFSVALLWAAPAKGLPTLADREPSVIASALFVVAEPTTFKHWSNSSFSHTTRVRLFHVINDIAVDLMTALKCCCFSGCWEVWSRERHRTIWEGNCFGCSALLEFYLKTFRRKTLTRGFCPEWFLYVVFVNFSFKAKPSIVLVAW